MSKTGKFLNPRQGGINGESSWKTQQAAMLKAHESDRKSRISPPSAKELVDMESAQKMDDMQLFSESDLESLAAEMAETPKLPINRSEYVRILSQGALNTEY